MSQDEYIKLFNYIENRFDKIDQKVEAKASQDSINKLINTVDHFIKRLDDIEVDQSARDLQFNRLLEWAKEVSRKTGIPLKNL